MPVDKVRDAAVDTLIRVFDKRHFLDSALDRTLRRRNIGDRGRRFLTQLVYGTVRHKLLCDHALAAVLDRPLESMPSPIQNILRLGVYQALFCDNVPFPAMVHTAVDLAKKKGHTGTARLVNAVLKRVPHHLDDVPLPDREADWTQHVALRHSLPPWLVQKLAGERGREWTEAFCAASNEQAPVTLRVNTLKTSPERLISGLNKAGFLVNHQTTVPEELTIVDHRMPLKTKLFQNGHFILQDPAAMIAAHLLEPRPEQRIADLCAAPGGKTTHLAQLTNDEAFIAAVDETPRRLERVTENAERLGLTHIHALAADGIHPPFPDATFEALLIDAPCSGLGTLRRHPDLKWRTDPGAPSRLAAVQRDLLRSAARLCKNGGLLVYAVCTVTLEETQAVVEDIIRGEALTPEDGPDWLQPWRITTGQYQTLPQNDRLDGFYLTRLRKG